MVTINYKNKEHILKMGLRAEYLFEKSEFSFSDFGDPQKRFQATVALMKILLDTDDDLETVARGLPDTAETLKIILALITERSNALSPPEGSEDPGDSEEPRRNEKKKLLRMQEQVIPSR